MTLNARRAQWAGVCARDGHSLVSLLAWRCWHMFLDLLFGMVKVVLLRCWCCRVDLDGWCLKSKRLSLGVRLTLRRKLGRFAVLGIAEAIVHVWREARGRWSLQSGCIGCRLRLELRKVEIAAGLVADVHGLVKAPFRVEAIEDHGVDEDGDDFDNNLNKSTDQGPMLATRLALVRGHISVRSTYLHAAHQVEIDLILIDVLPFPVLARPTPHILTFASVFAVR